MLLLDGEHGVGVRDGGLDLRAVADDPRIGEQALDVRSRKAGDCLRVEARERAAISLPLAQDRHPREPRLRSFERQVLEQMTIVVRRYAPLLVVIGDHQVVVSRPGTTRDCHDARIGSHAMRGFLVAALAALLLLAGCGGNGDDEASGDQGAGDTCEQVKSPEPRQPPELEAPTEHARPREDLRARVRHELRKLHGEARPAARAGDDGVARLARREGLLRRHGLPPHRPGLRDPGRRPHPDGHGRARVHDDRPAAGRGRVHERRRRDGEVAGRSRPARRAASSSSSRPTTRSSTRTTRSSAR